MRLSVIECKYNAAALQTCPRLIPEHQRPLTVILTVPVFFGITILRGKAIGYLIARVIRRRKATVAIK